jgi:hypothetical protein
MDSVEHLYKIIFFYNLDKKVLDKKDLESAEKKCFHESFKQFLPQEMKSCISLLDIPSGEEAEIVYPVMLPKFAIYCVTFHMVSFHEKTEEHLLKMREQLEIIVQYCCNRKEDFDDKNLEWALKYPKVLLLGTAEDEYKKQTEDSNYEQINEKLIRLRDEFSFLSPTVIVPAVNNLFFYPMALSKPCRKVPFPSPNFGCSSPKSHNITTEISDYFKSLGGYVRLFQSLTTSSCDVLLKYSFWRTKLLEMGNSETEIEKITNYLQSFNLLTWTKAFQSIYSDKTSIDASIVILKPFTFFSNLIDCLLKLNKTVKPNYYDNHVCDLVNKWNTELDKKRERRRFCDLGVVSKDILDDFLKNKIVTECLLDYKNIKKRLLHNETVTARLVVDADKLFFILKTFGIITVCDQEFSAPANSNLITAPEFIFKTEEQIQAERREAGQQTRRMGQRVHDDEGNGRNDFLTTITGCMRNRRTHPGVKMKLKITANQRRQW